jgi:hypothetical protein
MLASTLGLSKQTRKCRASGDCVNNERISALHSGGEINRHHSGRLLKYLEHRHASDPLCGVACARLRNRLKLAQCVEMLAPLAPVVFLVGRRREASAPGARVARGVMSMRPNVEALGMSKRSV